MASGVFPYEPLVCARFWQCQWLRCVRGSEQCYHQVIPSSFTCRRSFPTPDESGILIYMNDDIQVWSLSQFMDTNAPRDDIRGVDLSHDASLLALATETGIEIWDARIGQRRQVIQSRKGDSWHRAVAFSPKGELIVSSSKDGFIVVDVRAGELMPITYSSSPPRGQDVDQWKVERVEISFDSSKLTALRSWYDMESDKMIPYICVWDLPSGTLLHSLECNEPVEVFQWSSTDQYLLFKPRLRNPRYLNAETFQEEVSEHPGDRFQRPSHLYYDEEKLKIRLNVREGPLFSALPLNLNVREFSLRGDRACILSWNRRLLLLDMSGLEAYLDICNLSPPRGRC